MKKRLKMTLEIDTDAPEAKRWVKICDYVDSKIDEALDDFRKQHSKNYTRTGPGFAYKVSLRTVKKQIIKE